jgi:hypothetical protein
VSFFPRPLRGPDCRAVEVSPAQDTSASGVGKRLMSRPISAISAAAASPAKARNLIQPVRSWQRGGIAGPPGRRPGDAVRVHAPGRGDRGPAGQ